MTQRSRFDETFDNYTARLVGEFPVEQAWLDLTWGPVRELANRFAAQAETITREPDVTPEWRTRKLTELAKQRDEAGREHLPRLETVREDNNQEIVAVEHAAATGLVRAGAGWVKADKESELSIQEVIRQQLADQELRAHLRTLDGHVVTSRFLQALETGSDPDLIRAVEGDPTRSLVTDSVRLRARQWKIERSPFAAELRRLRARQSTHAMLLDAAKRELITSLPEPERRGPIPQPVRL